MGLLELGVRVRVRVRVRGAALPAPNLKSLPFGLRNYRALTSKEHELSRTPGGQSTGTRHDQSTSLLAHLLTCSLASGLAPTYIPLIRRASSPVRRLGGLVARGRVCPGWSYFIAGCVGCGIS